MGSLRNPTVAPGIVGTRQTPQAQPLRPQQGVAPWLRNVTPQPMPGGNTPPPPVSGGSAPWYADLMRNRMQAQELARQQALAEAARNAIVPAAPAAPSMPGYDDTGRWTGPGRDPSNRG